MGFKKLLYERLDEAAWTPLPEDERLDAYYHHCELTGAAALALKLAEEQPKPDRPADWIAAESLRTLPEPRDAETGFAALGRLRLKLDGAPPPEPLPPDSESVEEVAVGKKKRKKSTRHQKEPAAALAEALIVAVARPASAPAARPPVRTYATQYRPEVRAAPEVPQIELCAKANTKRTQNNEILTDDGAPAPALASLRPQPPARDKVFRAQRSPGRGELLAPDKAPRERTVTYTGMLIVSLAAPTAWATVRYTLDGSEPGKTSRIYRGPFEVRARAVLRCSCVKRGWSSKEAVVNFIHKADMAGAKLIIMAVGHEAAVTAKQRRVFEVAQQKPGAADAADPAALLKAVRLRNVPRLRALLDCGASVFADSVHDGGLTPLVAACRTGDVISTQLLLAHGAHPSFPAGGGTTPLHAAAAAGAAHCVELLLAAGATADAAADDGQRPLHAAAAAGARHCVELLLRAHVDPDDPTPDGESPLAAACRHGDEQGAPRVQKAASGAPPGVEARDMSGVVEALLAAGAAVDRPYKGRRPLLYAMSHRSESVVQILLKNGAKPAPPAKIKTEKRVNTRRGKAGINA
ncbi:ankyrin repeat-containing domain protein [Pelagophyceae sp. CCMP2097]|nr:ankyrin repeat-containing domain protein [Pelagophyceae sp. CCMP2097]|mmetsp:Transcript_23485/g.79328  ORF Transcript_23485/g.79328 Transcript_23485/m.79328 type:complete len:579 (-) Transcript_23485:293-2029(-)